MELLQDFYETTLQSLKDSKKDKLWFNTNIKLGKLYYDRKDYTKLVNILKQLHQLFETDDGEDDLKKGTEVLEIYALEMQIYTEQKNNKKLKALYEHSQNIKSANPHPLIMGVIRECGGKMHLREGKFEKAHTDFFEAFKNYNKSGSPRHTTCLKYLILANMFMKSGINLFDSQEAEPFKNDPEILAMTNLVNAYQTNDINEFELIRRQNQQNMNDPLMRELIEDLLRNIRTQALIKIVNLYQRIYIPHISAELNLHVTEVENLLVSCILVNLLSKKIHSRVFYKMSLNGVSDLIITISDDESITTEPIGDAYIITPEGVIEILDDNEDHEFLLEVSDNDLVDDSSMDSQSEGDQNVGADDLLENHEDEDDARHGRFRDVVLWGDQIPIPAEDVDDLDASYDSDTEIYLADRDIAIEE